MLKTEVASLGFLCVACVSVLGANNSSIDVPISDPVGLYDVPHWKKDWPGCKFEDGVAEGHASVVQREQKNWLRVRCVAGQIGPEQGGVGWRWPFEKRSEVELQYTIQFQPGFEFVKGGKLPGLSGGPASVTGGRPADGNNGFSVRLMWRRDGRGEAYVYHMDQPEKYGESFAFPEAFRFPIGKPVHVRIMVAMNQPGQRDGKLQVWVRSDDHDREQHVVDKTNIRWRADDSFSVDSLLFEVFHGGNDSTWAPSRDGSVEFTDIKVAR